jgi:hypothetical protein
MRRDTYHDYVTFEEICDSGRTASGYLRGARNRLAEISGARNVRSARVVTLEDPSLMVVKMAVCFDSRAWTGR